MVTENRGETESREKDPSSKYYVRVLGGLMNLFFISSNFKVKDKMKLQ